MIAEIVSVGTEILMGQIVDTHAQNLGRAFPEYGISHFHRQTIGDNLGRLTEGLRLALSRADVVFTIGGLGPTDDDLTREAIIAALNDELELNPEVAKHLQAHFEKRGFTWHDKQLKQAMVPKCAEIIENPNGTAPGLVCRKTGKTLIAMPGPKSEFNSMLAGPVRRILSEMTGGEVITSRTLHVCGLGESVVEEKIRAFMAGTNPSIGTYAHPGSVDLRLTAKAATEQHALELIAPVEASIRRLLGRHVFGIGADSLESVILEMIRKRGETLSTAESCTGGGIGHRITQVPGSSDVYVGGIVSYSNSVKETALGVEHASLEQFGAVSEEVAIQMAEGVRKRLNSSWSVAVTGVAGPGGGTDEKPVGLVFISISGPGGTSVKSYSFPGNREQIRDRSIQWALIDLRNRLLDA